ncbi:MAG: hypothetical protein IKO20_04045 [Bacteroidaceae bacterium]|nr:hypothetical protein [Bacteroidaceae bacterium]
MKLASHNTVTYLPIKQWYLRPFTFMARCQSRSYIKQYKRCARFFDIRVRFDKNGKPYCAHGLAAYDINPFRIIGKLEKLAYIDDEKIYIRLLLESTSKRNADFQEQLFKYHCERMEKGFQNSTNIILCGGQTKRDWHTVYDFKNPLPPIIELYASAPAQRNPLWKICPYLYRKYITRKIVTSEFAMRKDLLLMIDFI